MALKKSGLYIAPTMQYSAEERKISATLRSAHTTTKVLLLEHLPSGAQSSWQLAAAVHEQLALSDGLVVVVTERPRRIVAYGAGLDRETLQRIGEAPTKTFDAEGYAAGVAHIVRLVDQERAGRSHARIQIVALSIGMALVAAILFLRSRRRNAV